MIRGWGNNLNYRILSWGKILIFR